MPLDKQLMTRIRGLDDYDLRRLLIFVRGLLVTRGDPPDPATSAAAKHPAITYRLESVSCGKPGCTKCPHGPYWYAYWREGARVRSRYIGKNLPAAAKSAGDPAPRND